MAKNAQEGINKGGAGGSKRCHKKCLTISYQIVKHFLWSVFGWARLDELYGLRKLFLPDTTTNWLGAHHATCQIVANGNNPTVSAVFAAASMWNSKQPSESCVTFYTDDGPVHVSVQGAQHENESTGYNLQVKGRRADGGENVSIRYCAVGNGSGTMVLLLPQRDPIGEYRTQTSDLPLVTQIRPVSLCCTQSRGDFYFFIVRIQSHAIHESR